MSQSNMNQQQPEEVDVLQLFAAIGQFFSKFFRGTQRLLSKLFYLIIEILLYIRQHWLVLAGGTLAGLGFAFLLHQPSVLYYTKAHVRTNYQAQMALAEKIDLINDLIDQGNVNRLAKILNTDTIQAGHFVKMDIKPLNYEPFLWQDYQDFLSPVDTIFYKSLEFKKYKENVKKHPELNKYWEITAYADDPQVFTNFNHNFSRLILSDSAIIKRQNNYISALKIHRQKMQRSLKEIDSLRRLYNKFLLESVKNTGTIASNVLINSPNGSGPERPYDLFSKRSSVLNDLERVNQKINRFDKALIYLNRFSETGKKYHSVLQNKYIKFALIGFLLVMFILLLKDFNAYLSHYQKLKQKQ